MADTSDTLTPEPMWAKVEIFGHRKHFGRVTEVEQFGTKMLRVDVPLAEPDTFETFTYGGAAIFGITPLTEKAARKWAEYYRPADIKPMALLPPAFDPLDESDGPQIVDADEEGLF
jgi:hypothetical protein